MISIDRLKACIAAKDMDGARKEIEQICMRRDASQLECDQMHELFCDEDLVGDHCVELMNMVLPSLEI